VSRAVLVSNKLVPRKQLIRLRRQRAWELYIDGYSYAGIAELNTTSRTTAFQDVQWAMQEYEKEHALKQDQKRFMERERLEALIKPLKEKAYFGDVAAARELVHISESIRKLEGLDAPKKIAATTVAGDDLYDITKLSDEELEERMDNLKRSLRESRNPKVIEVVAEDVVEEILEEDEPALEEVEDCH